MGLTYLLHLVQASISWETRLRPFAKTGNFVLQSGGTHQTARSWMIESNKLAEFAKHPELALQNINELLSLLDSNDEAELNTASDLLENCGAPSRADIPFLCDQLKSRRSSTVYWCSTLLGRLGATVGERSRIDSELCQAICDESLELSARERAAWAIGQLGKVEGDGRASLEKHVEKAPARLKRLLETALAT